MIMNKQQIDDIVKYLGCECGYTDGVNRIIKPFTLDILWNIQWNRAYLNFELYPKPLSALTQEDFERMKKDVHPRDDEMYKETPLDLWLNMCTGDALSWRYADWLRNEGGYYLNEESIEKFVKQKS